MNVRVFWATLCAGVALAAAPAAAAVAAVSRDVDAGALRATVTADPWRIVFTDAGGTPVLGEVTRSDGGPTGTLGFRDATTSRWSHATRVVDERRDGGAYLATLATDDPLGRRLAVRVAPDGDGVVALEATVQGSGAAGTGIAFDAPPGERHLGFGERSNAVDQRGNAVENYVAEGPYQPVERPLLAGFVPPPGFRQGDDVTYFPIPWLLSTRGFGVLSVNDEPSRFGLGTVRPDAWSFDVDAASLSLRVFAGPRPSDALQRFTSFVGRQPPAAAPFYFGPWWQPLKGAAKANMEQFVKADVPTSVAQTYTHYLPCGDQRALKASDRERTDLLHRAGQAVTTYFNPMICTDYHPRFDEAVNRGLLTKTQQDQPYEYRYTGSGQFLVGQFDFTNPAATSFFGDLLGEAVADGYDGWMEDFGEYTPLDAKQADGSPGPVAHNRYPRLYHGAAMKFSRERSPRPLARFNRSGWTGSAKESQIVWNGDPTTDFGFDGLESAVRNGLTMGLSGVSLWGSDVGGYFALSKNQTTSELLIRWLEFGAVSGVMRLQANGFDFGRPGAGRRAQVFDPDVLPQWRRYAKLRTQLYPYLAAAEAEYDATGMPIMRHMALVDPGDPRAVAQDTEYGFGPDVIAAPVVAAGQTQRELYVPRGRWVDLWRSASTEADGSLKLGRPAVLDGARPATLPAPLGELPLLVRAGAVLPLLPADVDTLADYGAGSVTRLADRRGEMALLAFPRGNTTQAFGDGGESILSREGTRRWTLHVKGKRARNYSVQATLSSLEKPFTPCAVRVGLKRFLPRKDWSYDRSTGVLRFTARVTKARVNVLGKCRRHKRR